MPNSIDERVVQMTFDNKQFEQGVSTSLKTLDDLKKALNFDEVENSLKNIEEAFNGVDFSGLENSIDAIAAKFSPLGVLAVTVMQRISNAAIDAGKKVADAFLGISEMSAGQSKYETQTKAVQTITNATGKTVEEVEEVLKKLMHYTDETSYDFSEMVASIGKFTSVGIDLERSEKAMEGIANWAAKSGAGKAEANRAMYNIAQSLSTGSLKLIDWKSIENANMATKEFKETVIQTAIEMGVLQDKGDGVGAVVTTNEEKLKKAQQQLAKAQTATKDRAAKVAAAQEKVAAATKESTISYKNFNSTLSDGWLTSDVLIATLEKYSDTSKDFGAAAYQAAREALTWSDALDAVKDAVSSGWMQSYKYIFGNLDEARVMWTNVAEALVEYTDIFTSWRNKVLEAWHIQGGYNDMIEAASNLWQTFMNIVLGVGDALVNVFPILKVDNMTDALVNGTKQLKEWSESLFETFGLTRKIEEEENEVADGTEEIKESVDDVKESVTATVEKTVQLSEATKEAAEGFKSITTGLKRGARGNDVKKLQKQLMALGFSLDKYGADGIFGPETQAALKELQKALGIEQTGILDEMTKAALQNEEALRKLQSRAKQGIKLGDKGESVKKLQKELNKYLSDSEKLAVDGIMGPKTEAALKKLQKELGVKQTGVWDEATKSAAKYAKYTLINLEKVSKALKSGMSGDDVKVLQEQLKKAGYLAADFIADGIYGPETEEAVKKLQKALGLAETGVWDRTTYIALSNAQEMIRTYGAAGVAAREASIEEYKASDAAEENAEALEKEEEAVSRTTIAMMRLQNIVKGFASAIKIVTRFVGSIGEIAGNVLRMFEPLVNVLVRFGSYVGTMFENLANDLEDNNVYGKFVKRVTIAFMPLYDVIKGISGAIGSFLDAYDEFLERTGSRNTFGNFFTFLGDYLKQNPVLKFVIESFQKAGSIIATVVGFVSEKIKAFFALFSTEQFQNGRDSVFAWIAAQWEKLKNVFTEFKAAHPELTLENFWNSIKNFGAGVRDFFAPLIGLIASKFGEFKSAIDSFFENHPEISLSNFLEALLNFGKKGWGMISKFFAPGQQSESGNFLDEFKERLKAFEPIIDWLEGIKDKIVALWNSIFGVPNGEGTDNKKVTDPLSPMVDTLKTTEEKLSVFDRVVDWFVGIKDKIVNAWNELMGIGKEDGVPLEKEKGFISVADKLKDFGKFLVDNWPAITLATIGLSFAYGLINAIVVARNLSKGFAGMADALKKKLGKGNDKDTIGNTALKIAGAILMVAGAIALLSLIPADQAWEGFKPFIAVLSSMTLAVILINKLGGEGNDGAKNALMLAGSIGIIAAALWLLCKIVVGNDLGTIIGAMAIIEVVLITLGVIAVKIAKNSKGDVAVKGFLSMCAGVYVLVLAVKKMVKLIKDNPDQILSAILVIAIMVGELGLIATWIAKNSDKGVELKGFLGMCAGVYVLVLAVKKMVQLIKDNPDQILSAILVVALMVGELGLIATWLTKSSTASGASGVVGFLGLCAGVYVLVLAFGRLLNILSGEGITLGKAAGAFVIIALLVAELGIIAVALNAGVVRGGAAKITSMLALVGAVWVLVETYGRLVSIISKNNQGVLAAAAITIGVLVGALAYIASQMGGGDHPLLAGIGNAITFVALAFALEKILKVLGDVIVKIKDVNPEVLKWFFIGIDGAIAIMAGTVAVLGKLFESNPVGLLIGEAGLLALLGVLAAGIEILSRVGESALNRFANAMKRIGWGMESFNTSTKGIDLDRLKNIGEYLKDTLPQMMKSILGLNTDGAVEKIKDVFSIGVYLELYSIAISKIGQEAVTGASNAFDMLDKTDEVANKLNGITMPSDDKIYSLFEFGVGLYAYGYTLSQLTTGNETAISTLVTQTSSLLGIVTDVEKLEAASTSIQGLAGALEIYYQALSGKAVDDNGNLVENGKIDSDKMAQRLKEVVGAFTDEELDELAAFSDDGEKGKKMTNVANGIANLSLAFKSYSENIGTLDPTQVGLANEVIEKVNKINVDQAAIDSLYTSFGDGARISGGFVVALNIFALGVALSSYASNIGGLSKQNVKNANDVLDEVIKIRNHVKLTNAPINVFEFLRDVVKGAKDFNLTEFSGDIGKLGTALQKYGSSISVLSLGKVLLANTVLEKILNVSERTQTETWWTRLLFGTGSTLSAFATNVGDLGGGLRDFCDNIGQATIDDTKLGKILDQGGIMDKILALSNAVKEINSSDLVVQSWDGVANLSKFKYVANEIKEAFDTLNTVTINDNAAKAIETFGSNIVGTISGTVKNEDSITTFCNSVVSLISGGFEKAFNTESDEIEVVGMDIVSYVKNGISDEDSITIIKDAIIKSIIGTIRRTLFENFDTFTGFGKYIDRGVAIGLGENASIVTRKAEEVAWAAYEAACKKLEIQSPSKKFIWIGEMLDAGLAKGITVNKDKVVDSMDSLLVTIEDYKTPLGANVGDAVENAISDAIPSGTADSFIDKASGWLANFLTMPVQQDAMVNGYEEDVKGIVDSTKETITNYAKEKATEAVGDVGSSIETAIGDEITDLVSNFDENGVENITSVIDGDLESILANVSDNTYTLDPEVELDIDIVDNPTAEEIAEIEKLEKLVNETVDGITLDSIDVSEIFDENEIKASMTSSLDKIGEAVTDAGNNVDGGFVKGIVDNLGDIKDAGDSIVSNIVEPVLDGLMVASPSKKFIWIGEMVDKGLVIGLQNGISEFGKATNSITENIVNDVTEKLGLKKNRNTIADGLAKLFTMPVRQESIMYGYADSIKGDLDKVEAEISDCISKFKVNDELSSAFFGGPIYNGIKKFFSITPEEFESFEKDMTRAFGNISNGIGNAINDIKNSDIAKGIGDAFSSVKSTLKESLENTDILDILGKGIVGDKYDRFKTLFTLDDSDWDQIKTDVKSTVEGVATDISESVSNAFNGITNNEIVQGFGDLISTIPFVEKLEILKTGLAPKISDFVSHLFDVEEKTIDYETKTRTEAFMSLAEDIMNPIVEFSGDISAIAFDGIRDTISTEYTNMMGRMFEGTELPGAEDIASKISEVIKNASNVVKNDDNTNTKQVGKKIDEDVTKGIDDTDKKKSLSNVFQRVIESLRTFIVPFVEKFKNVGINIDNGIINGLSQNSSLVSQKAREVALVAYNAACQALGINSPSTAFIWIGEMLGEGLTQGISSYSKNVGSAAAKVADTAVSNAENGVMRLFDVIGFDDMDQPVIRPVLDLTDIQSGIQNMNSMFDSSSIVAKGNVAFAQGIAARQTSSQTVEAKVKEDQNAKFLTEAIGKLNEKIDSVTDDLSNFKIYLDGNTLVGYMSPKIDRNLGQKTMLSRRMN